MEVFKKKALYLLECFSITLWGLGGEFL